MIKGSGWTYQELDDLDSAIGDSLVTTDEYIRKTGLEGDTTPYRVRIMALRERVRRLMDAEVARSAFQEERR